MDGELSGSTSPKIMVELYGVTGRQSPPVFFEAIIDTGFTGGVSMPISLALPLGLVLFSTATFTLADGSKENAFLCFGSARIGERQEDLVFSLSQGNDILLGTEFLKAFKAKFSMDYKTSKFFLEPQEPEQSKLEDFPDTAT
jgi:predicted aspartyl protease